MPLYAGVILSALLLLLSIMFKIAGKLRLSIPFLYALLVGSVFHKWEAENTVLAYGIFYALIAFSVLSWIYSAYKRIKRWKYEKMRNELLVLELQQLKQQGYENAVIDPNGGNPVVRIEYD